MGSQGDMPVLAHILIVDDEPANVELLQRVFMRNYQITLARNGKDALQVVANTPVDLVLLDIMMPVLNGIDTLRIIRETPQTAELPVILISALSDSDQIAAGLKMGANDYITKPFDITVIKARVRTQIKLKQLTDERKQTIDQLQRANRVKERLMQVASHDLRNPLTNLRMLHRLMLRLAGDNQRLTDLVERGDAIVDTMLAVIANFLDAESGSDNMQIHLEAVPAADVVDEVLAQYIAAAHNKRISIERDELPLVSVLADPQRLAQVISNLISNAIKYSPLEKTIQIYAETKGDFWRLSVADQGPGIPENERDKLFQPFKRLSNKPTAGESSTGLGLWIVKEMMQLQGGAVGVTCPTSGGSIFWIELPLAPSAAAV